MGKKGEAIIIVLEFEVTDHKACSSATSCMRIVRMLYAHALCPYIIGMRYTLAIMCEGRKKSLRIRSSLVLR